MFLVSIQSKSLILLITYVYIWAIIEIKALSVLKLEAWSRLKSCESWSLIIEDTRSLSVIILKHLFEIVKKISIEKETRKY